MARWAVTATKQTGTSHLRRGEECADAFAVEQGDGFLVLVAADGAGSARYGAEGSAFAARAAARLAASALGEQPDDPLELIRSVFRNTLDDLLDMVEEREAKDLRPADFHTTLLLAVLTDDFLAVGNVGDGWAVVRDREGQVRAVAAPAKSEYSNETFFLTSSGFLEEAVYEVLPATDLDAIALLTDGSAWFAVDLDARTPSGALFDKLFAFAADTARPDAEREEHLTRFLSSDLVVRKTDDDTTLVLAVQVPD